MAGARIELREVTASWGRTRALDRMELLAPAGRVTAIVGPSGSGKSTLLAVVAGLLQPQSGEVLFDGRSVLGVVPERRQIGVVFQSYALFPHLSVEDNVAFGLVARGKPRAGARAEVRHVLERFEIDALARRYPYQLSGGEKQRVALARALAIRPRALLLDEPLSALDARLRIALRSELARHLRESGVSVLYVTHDQQEAMALGDRVAVIHRGKLEQCGAPEELYRAPGTPFVAGFLGEANFLPVRWDPATRRLRGPYGDWRVDEAAASRFDGPREGSLLVRPAMFRLCAPGSAHLRGRVVSASFRGDRRRLGVASGGRTLEVDVPAETTVRAGEPICLRIDLDSTALLPKTAGPSDAVPHRGERPEE